ncbi:MAG: hypothetical protein WCH62_09395, partial [Candidatus Omnitrophota bacterium]
GLVQKSDTRDQSGAPFLKDLPFVGWLFKTASTDLSNGELTVFITAHIIPMPQDTWAGKKESSATLIPGGEDMNLLSGLLVYADGLEHNKSKDFANNLYLSEEQIKAYRTILQHYPQSGKSDYCLYKIAFIYAKEFGRCNAAKAALIEMKDIAPRSPYVDVTESLVNACIAVNGNKDEK